MTFSNGFRTDSGRCRGELIHQHGQALLVEVGAQSAGPGECRQTVETAPDDLSERLDVAVTGQRRQCVPQLDKARMHRSRGVGLAKLRSILMANMAS